MCDLTPSLDFGSVGRDKRKVLTDTVAAIARILTRGGSGGGNRIGAFLYDGNAVHYLPARNGRRQVLELIDRILRHPSYTESPPTDLRELLDSARGNIKRRSLVFLISDFHSASGWEKSLGALAMKNEIIAIRVFDPLEMAIPDLGIVLFSDAESGKQIEVDTNNRRFRERYAEVAMNRVIKNRDALGQAGVDSLEVATNDDLVETIVRFVRLRNYRSNLSTERIR